MPIDEIEVIKQRLVDQIKPIGVYLFGSFANGTAHADSDFDFYIIVDDNEKDLHAVAASAYKAIRGVKQRPVDCLESGRLNDNPRSDSATARCGLRAVLFLLRADSHSRPDSSRSRI